jgi:hypothetical protein
VRIAKIIEEKYIPYYNTSLKCGFGRAEIGKNYIMYKFV